MQYRCPIGAGPSLNKCPRCEPQFLQVTSVLVNPSESSGISSICSLLTGLSKLGQPDPESNFVSEENSSCPQAAQTYIPESIFW